jgi:DNA-binding GntR family transcriptional regulator
MGHGLYGLAPEDSRMPWNPRIANETAPLYIAIADAIAADAENGRLAPGTRLPTHR